MGDDQEPVAAARVSELTAEIADLQMRLTYQEDEIGHLTRVLEEQRVELQRQADQIEQLHAFVAALAKGIREQITDGPPPHY